MSQVHQKSHAMSDVSEGALDVLQSAHDIRSERVEWMLEDQYPSETDIEDDAERAGELYVLQNTVDDDKFENFEHLPIETDEVQRKARDVQMMRNGDTPPYMDNDREDGPDLKLLYFEGSNQPLDEFTVEDGNVWDQTRYSSDEVGLNDDELPQALYELSEMNDGIGMISPEGISDRTFFIDVENGDFKYPETMPEKGGTGMKAVVQAAERVSDLDYSENVLGVCLSASTGDLTVYDGENIDTVALNQTPEEYFGSSLEP